VLDIRGFGKVVFQESAKFGKKTKFQKIEKNLFLVSTTEAKATVQLPGPDQLPSLLL